jgi:lysophospholipase L1-like esterase
MSVVDRVRACALVCCAAAAAALGVLAMAPAAGAVNLGSTYLALGDSLTYGFHQAKFEEELSKGEVNAATFNDGYVDDFSAVLKLVRPKLQVINDGCPGETSETFIHGSGITGFCAGGPTGTPFPDSFLHHPYSAGGSQLADALSILASNPNVSPISVDIGANDVLQFLKSTCGFPANTCTEEQIIGEYFHIAGNLESILSQLRAAAPHAEIVVIGNYNPFPTVQAAPGGDAALKGLNEILAQATGKTPGASFTSVEPAFNAPGFFGGFEKEAGDIPIICKFTAMCPGGTFNPASPEADIHPTKLGYSVMAAFELTDFATH